MLAEPIAAAVWDWLQRRFPGRIDSLDDSPQLDLGLDSLAWLGLTLEIEQRFERTLGQQAIGRIVTLRDLLREVSAAPKPAAARRLTPPLASPSAPARVLGLLLHLLDRAAMALVFRLRVEGRTNLPGSGPCLLVPNHASYLDPMALAAALPFRQLPEIHWAGWAALLFSTRLMRLLSRAGQVFPVDPEHGSLAGIGTARALLDEGGIVVWFPEGRRSPDGHLQTFQPGIGFLMAATGAPVVPVRICGTFEAWPRWRRLPRAGRITVVFGRPIERDEAAPPGDRPEIHLQIADRLRAAVAAL